jgi:hypothetical protein
LLIAFCYVTYTTTGSLSSNTDNKLTIPTASTNAGTHALYIPVLYRPLSTWSTTAVITRVNSDYYIHTLGTTAQSYEITWIINIWNNL